MQNPFFQIQGGITNNMSARSKPVYDLPTAITFFLAGLGIGAVLAVILSPRADAELAASAPTPAYSAR
jgi:hypothetical protein